MIFNSSMTFLKTTRFFAYSIVIGANQNDLSQLDQYTMLLRCRIDDC